MNLNFDELKDIKPLQIFDAKVITFLDALSKDLLKKCKRFPDASTFGFWCRESSIEKMKTSYGNCHRIGRGIVFHIAPSNVAVNFAYSLVVGLLSGNANIVRLPSKHFAQVEMIVETINLLIDKEYDYLMPYIHFVRYKHDKDMTDYLSLLCDIRVIWGGDNTIKEIRKSPLRARAGELTFADRYSMLLINADEYIIMNSKKKIAQDFYNNTYLFDQNACTSPKIVIWVGNAVNEAKESFWNQLHKIVVERYHLQPVQALNKLTEFCKAAAVSNKLKLVAGDNFITRIELKTLDNNINEYFFNSGYFFEYTASELGEILPVCGEKCQTLAYLGVDKSMISEFLFEQKPKGVDRVCQLGKMLDFSLVWDGYDLIYSLSRIVNI